MSHEYHKNPDVVDAMNPQQCHLTQETGTERPGAATGRDSEYERAHQWRDATRDLVLAGATATAAAGLDLDHFDGNALSNDVLLANDPIVGDRLQTT